jgi:MinD-like ATPase involved in chromosome partitioning or flagellar assembly
VQATPVKNLEVIASGPETPNPAELLSLPMLPEFLMRVREDYDTAIIDTPPLLAVADPAIIGALVDSVVLVARVATTRRDDAARAVEMLKGLGVPILGGLINGISPEPDLRSWIPPWREEIRGHRYIREIRIDSQLIFVPGADLGVPPGVGADHLHAPLDELEERGS